MLRTAAVFALLLLAATIAAKPVRPLPPYHATPMPPVKSPRQLAAERLTAMSGHKTQYGTIVFGGDCLELVGHSAWCTSGLLRDDGRILLTWTNRNSASVYFGFYEVECDGLKGTVCSAGSAIIDEHGVLKNGFHERIQAAPPQLDHP